MSAGHLLTAAGVFAAVCAPIFGFGLATLAACSVDVRDSALRLALGASVGCLELAAVVLLAGHLGLLYSPLLAVVGVAGVGALWYARHSVPRLRLSPRRWPALLRTADGLLVAITAAAIAAAVAAGVRRPWMADELGYHWTAPLRWAALHHWGHSPYRLTNGPALMEWLYTLPALTGSYEAAHWLHTLTLGVLLLSAASIARSLGLGRPLAVAGVISLTCMLNEAAWAYNDIAAGAFALTGAAVALSPEPLRGRFWLAGAPLAAAALTKSFLFGAVPAILVGMAFGPARLRGRKLVDATVALAAVPALLFGLASLRTLALIGRLTDTPPSSIKHYGEPHWWLASGYVPDLRHTPLLPLEPLFTGALGQSEPYGGRTGIFLLILLPVALWVYFRGPRDPRASALLAMAAAFLVFVGLIFPRTRFLIFAYALLCLFVVAVLGSRWSHGRRATALKLVAAFAVTLSVADSFHVLYRGLL